MSSYANSNYGPPQNMGQYNAVNGMPPLGSTQIPQQPQQQQQQMSQPMQQKQQQFPGMPVPPATLNTNLSKFMPPSMTASGTPGNFAPSPNTNGPQRMPSSQPPIASNLPPHMRPPGAMNGPTHGSNSISNGGGAGVNATASANSSRTASPSIQLTQQQHQYVPTSSSNSGKIPPASHPPIASASTPGMNQLNSSMQNLNMNRINGTALPPTTVSASQSMPMAGKDVSTVSVPNAQAQPVMNNFPANFKTSALNTQHVGMGSPNPSQNTTANLSNRPPQPQQPLGQPLRPPISTYNTPSSTPMTYQQSPSQNANYPNSNVGGPPISGSIPRPPTNSGNVLQNQLNNNQPTPHIQANASQQPMGQRKPMYPNQQLPPPMQQQQQSQQFQQQPQQAYSAAYNYSQQQMTGPPQPTGMFNGQPNSGPLQYQNQKQAYQQQQQTPQYPAGSVVHQGFNRLWGQDTIDLMQNRHILSPATLAPPKIVLHNQFHESINCNPNIMRCTLAKIPESNSLLQKSRLPLGIVIHPFRDINSLPVIQCPNIVRCRLCRTYINPFVYFVDSKMWKCNLCYRVNELPEDFQFDPATKTYGDVTRRPEVRSSTIEFIAPSEYMLRPPQPAIYLFLFDVSIIAQQCGYLENVCALLTKHLDDMPGDARTQVGFIAYNSNVHFYSMAEGYNQPHEMTLLDIDDPFLPRPDNLLVNLKECKELVKDLLNQLPTRFADTHDPGSALGAALQVAFKLMQASGGRITVFQTCLPNKGPGALEPREDPNNRSAKDVAHLNPATDFYKRYALECSGYQIACDLFLLNQQYSDIATISGISKHSGGCVHHFPLYQKTKAHLVDSLKHCFKRYLVRKIGFEAVMRIRCTRGLQVHTFHGNFFVRSTDLLSLPNVNPDAGYGMQISYEESLTDVKTICFQAALLYTNSEGERRIRVHTMCLPVTASLPEVMHAADTEAIIGLLSKMAVDRSITSNIADAREAFINATVDILNAFKIAQNLPSGQSGQLIAPRSLALLPLYISALLKHPAFRVGTSTRLDDRVYAMDCMKSLPLDQLMKFIYPEFYNIDILFYHNQNANTNAAGDADEEDDDLPEVQRLQLSAEHLDSRSIFLMDCGTLIIIYVGLNVPVNILESVFGIKTTAELPDYYYGLPSVNSTENDALKRFIMKLNDEKPYPPIVQIIRDTSTAKPQLIEKLVDDRSESSLSYYEFLQHIRTQVK
ncbi:protein transport protein Sec24A-like [Musca domestica]|uniref:Protein transport protein Sec24A-like n=1 Tax=Musca domestica TaxID=7370 RepID=A0A1I8MQZ3_MUSDO|nr:protein transport protein Sec24A-like [Musca domestica]